MARARRGTEHVRIEPFMAWLNERYARYEQEVAGAGNEAPGAAIQLAGEIGWIAESARLGAKNPADAAVRRLYRFRRGLSDTKRGGRKAPCITVVAKGYQRETVEDALHCAGADFYELYSEYAHERDGQLEPEAWCPGCADHVLVVRNKKEESVCIWCDWVMTDGHLNGLGLAA